MDSARNNKISLVLGLALLTAGLLFLLLQSSEGLARWMMQMWPVFLICAGLSRVAGFAIDRKPRSPADGMLLIALGIFFLIARLHADLNPLQIYGRYWILLVALFACVEVIRFYTGRAPDGQARMFTTWRLVVLLLIIATGVAANRIGNNTSMIYRLRLPVSISGAPEQGGSAVSSARLSSAIMNEASGDVRPARQSLSDQRSLQREEFERSSLWHS